LIVFFYIIIFFVKKLLYAVKLQISFEVVSE